MGGLWGALLRGLAWAESVRPSASDCYWLWVATLSAPLLFYLTRVLLLGPPRGGVIPAFPLDQWEVHRGLKLLPRATR